MDYKKYLNFSIILIVLSLFDVISTRYALTHIPYAYEGNPFMKMFSGSFLAMVLVKSIALLVIINLYRRIRVQSEKSATIGKTIITSIMLLVLINNLVVIGTAIEFDAYTTAGSVGAGNGYFDNENTIFNISEDKNIFVVAEPENIWILEPLGFPLGTSSRYNIVQKGNNNLRYAVVGGDGYLYYVDGDGIKQKISRDNTNPVVANETGIGQNSILIYSSADIYKLVPQGLNMYFVDGTAIKYFDYSTKQVSTLYTGINNAQGGIVGKSVCMIDTDAYYSVSGFNGNFAYGALYKNNGSEKNIYTSGEASNAGTAYQSVFCTQNYIYYQYAITGTITTQIAEKIFYANNDTLKSTNFYITPQGQNNVVDISSKSTTVLYRSSATKYNVFNFIEAGLSVIPTSGLVEYTANTIDVPASTYLNSTIVPISYDLRFIISKDNYDTYYSTGLLSFNLNVRKPDGTETETKITSIECAQTRSWWATLSSWTNFIALFVDEPYSCEDIRTKQYLNFPYMQNGTYTVSLNERYLTTNAMLDSDSWNVLNVSSNGTSETIINEPSGKTPEDVETKQILDGYVELMGFGVSDTSKFLFAVVMTLIAVCLGYLFSGKNGFISMMVAFGAYGFFTYIDYFPKWIMIIVIMILASKYFR